MTARTLTAACAVMAATLANMAVAAPAGAEWGSAVPVDGAAPGHAQSLAGHDVATGGGGQTTILFFQKVEGGAFLGNPFVVRRGAGDAGYGAPRPVNAANLSADPSPVLSANGAGDALGAFRWGSPAKVHGVAWPAAADAPGDAAVALCTGGATPVCATQPPRLAIDDQGRGYAVAATQANQDGTVLLARHDPLTGAWSDAEEMTAAGHRPMVAASPGGDLVVVYLKMVTNAFMQSERHLFARRQLRGEPGLGPEKRLSAPGDAVSAGHDVVLDGAATVTAVFAQDPQRPGFAPRIFARRWKAARPDPESAPELVSASSPAQPPASAPRAAVDPAGNVSVAWVETTSGPSIVAGERAAAGDRWLAPQPVAPASSGFGLDLAVDTDGTATLVLGAAGKVAAFRRAAGGTWGTRRELQAPQGGDVTAAAVRVSAANARQADVTFLQKAGTAADALDRLHAVRFVGPAPPGGGQAAAAEGCPAGNGVLDGTPRDDTLDGTPGADNVFGRGGDDRIGGRAGNDCIHAGTANDRAIGEAGHDAILGEDGADVLHGLDGEDYLDGGAGNDVLDGGAGTDRLTGGANVDRLFGGGGHDQLEGDAGDDRLFGLAGRDAMRGGEGNDRLTGGDGGDVLAGDAGHDRLFGNRGNDRLEGGAGRNRLSGGDGHDRIAGGPERDRIAGGRGRDRVLAGDGGDYVDVRDGARDLVRCGRGRDTAVVDRRDRVRGCERVWFARPRPRSSRPSPQRRPALFSYLAPLRG